MYETMQEIITLVFRMKKTPNQSSEIFVIIMYLRKNIKEVCQQLRKRASLLLE